MNFGAFLDGLIMIAPRVRHASSHLIASTLPLCHCLSLHCLCLCFSACVSDCLDSLVASQVKSDVTSVEDAIREVLRDSVFVNANSTAAPIAEMEADNATLNLFRRAEKPLHLVCAPLPSVSAHCPLPSATAFWSLVSALCPLSSVLCFLSSASPQLRATSTALCTLSTVLYTLPAALYFHSTHCPLPLPRMLPAVHEYGCGIVDF